MRNQITKLLSRLAAVALTLAVTAALYFIVVAPAYSRFELARDELAGQRALLGRLAQGITASADPAPIPPDLGRLQLAGESDAVMAATLQSLLRRTSEAAGWRLASTRVLPPREEGGLRLIGIEGRAMASLAALQRTLIELERARPLVVSTALQVSLAPAADDPAGIGALSVRVEIFGAAASPEDRNATR